MVAYPWPPWPGENQRNPNKAKMKTDYSTAPRLYVGTYAKYNAGNLAGAWLNLSDYSDREEFDAACHALHADESDPEIMYQDFEGFPRALYNECGLDDRLFDWLELDEDERTIAALWLENGCGDDISDAMGAFAGVADSLESWMENYMEESGGLESVTDYLRQYIDFDSISRDAVLNGDIWTADHDGQVYVFRNL